MKTISVSIASAALVALLSQPAGAEPLSRAQVVQRAARQNPRSAAARAAVDRARALRAEVDAARWPLLTVQLGVGPSMRASLVPGTAVESTEGIYDNLGANDLSAVFGGRIETIQPLYTFGKIALRQQAADFGVRAEKARAEMTRAEVALAAATLYETHLFARDAARFFEEIDHTLERSILATREQLARQKSSEQDLLRLEHARSLARLGLNQARAGVAQTAAGLRAHLALPDGEKLEIADPELAPLADPGESIDELVATALRRRPELTALEAGVAAFEKLEAAERAALRPNFFLMTKVDAAYTPGRDFVDTRYVIDPLGHFVPTLIAGVSWTFQWGSADARARQKRAEATRLARTRDWAVAGMPAEVRVARLDAERARADVGETSAGSDRAKKWLVQASADYAAGLADSRDLADAVGAYATMRIANLDAIRRLNTALATLARATGTLLDGSSPYTGGAR